MPYLQWLISTCIVYSRSQHENRLSLSYSSILPVFTMSVNVTVYMYAAIGPLSLQCSNAVYGEKPASLTGIVPQSGVLAQGGVVTRKLWCPPNWCCPPKVVRARNAAAPSRALLPCQLVA